MHDRMVVLRSDFTALYCTVDWELRAETQERVVIVPKCVTAQQTHYIQKKNVIVHSLREQPLVVVNGSSKILTIKKLSATRRARASIPASQDRINASLIEIRQKNSK